jgi:dephospho-CoA kinase
MLKVGLTGGIASGKSVVAEMFVALGAHLIQADQIAHELMQPGQSVYKAVVEQFGLEILNPDGTVNRPRLAEAAFGRGNGKGKSRVQELNRLVHPAVIARQDEWMEEVGKQDPAAVAMVEAALIFEAGAARRFDRLVVVTCREEQRAERLAARLKIEIDVARREVERRMAAQWPDERKVRGADYVIDNSGSLDNTERQVRAVYLKLKEEAERRKDKSAGKGRRRSARETG